MKIPLNFHIDNIIRSVSRRGVLGGQREFSIKDMEERVPKGRYTEDFVLIY